MILNSNEHATVKVLFNMKYLGLILGAMLAVVSVHLSRARVPDL